MPESPATLLVELLTEELPPRSLRALSEAFAESVARQLAQARLVEAPAPRVYATPRRLAFSIAQVPERAADRDTEVTGPSAKAPAQAIGGFARKHGLAPEQLVQRDSPKGPVVVARVRSKGVVLEQALAGMVEGALQALPISKTMRWGAGEAQFVRPVHGLVLMHGR
ncbi:MAG TPA: glycine--tRNA ligase subunit beta, partial [Burkholderiales bacterium]|nr:glycine--tRNA ligase subunit beta [Burkholderiales bacterium]